MTYRDNVNYKNTSGKDGVVTYNDSIETQYNDTIFQYKLVKQ